MNSSAAQIREDQIIAARRMAAEEGEDFRKPARTITLAARSAAHYEAKAQSKQPKQPKPTGHEAFLKHLECSGAQILVEKASSGDKVRGFIKAADKYTISLRVPLDDCKPDGAYTTRVIFKHDISEFQPVVENGRIVTCLPTAEEKALH